MPEGSSKKKVESGLDDWKPTVKKNTYRAPSKWRQERNSQGYGYMSPGLDEIKKIRAYLKNKTDDVEIMQQFAINADTLFAIKANRFDPVEGIIHNQTDILFRKQETLEKRLERCQLLLKNLVANITTNKEFIQWIESLVFNQVGQAIEGMPPNVKL